MRLRSRAIQRAALLLVCGVLAPPAAAETVQIDFYITVTSTLGDLVPLAGVPVDLGDRVRGSLVYDPAVPAVTPSFLEGSLSYPQPAGFIWLGLGSGITIPIAAPNGGMSVTLSGPRFFPEDRVSAHGTTHDFPGFDAVRADLWFSGSRDSLTLPANAGAFRTGYPGGGIIFMAWQTGVNPPFDSGTQEFFGTLEVVPEPGTLLLLAGGGATLLARRRRRAAGMTS